ncbi:hypothetical protein MMC30_005632 [Trapelia coarctata]|nr:hypothetical protein [Trapelia coarctata]
MPQSPPSPPPNLTPQFCFSQSALRDFLRLSRVTADDPITQNLNALSTPSRNPFNPSTLSRQPRTPSSHRIPFPACSAFTSSILFPSWHARSQALTYCASVATSPDPDDPDLLQRQVEGMREQERVVNERLDPYSGRFFPQEARTEELARRVREERRVEDIVRGRTWGVVRGRCEGVDGEWGDAFARWEKERGAGR